MLFEFKVVHQYKSAKMGHFYFSATPSGLHQVRMDMRERISMKFASLVAHAMPFTIYNLLIFFFRAFRQFITTPVV